MLRISVLTGAGLVVATAFAAAQAPVQPAEAVNAQAPEVTFRVEVNYVEEDVRVVDRDGNFVRGLKREDFQLTEDGKPQKINTFGMVDIPVAPIRRPAFMGPDALPIEADVVSNEQVLDGRLYLILLERHSARIAGVYAEPAAAARGDRQFHRAEDHVGGDLQDRRAIARGCRFAGQQRCRAAGPGFTGEPLHRGS